MEENSPANPGLGGSVWVVSQARSRGCVFNFRLAEFCVHGSLMGFLGTSTSRAQARSSTYLYRDFVFPKSSKVPSSTRGGSDTIAC